MWRDENGPWLTAPAIIRTVKRPKRKPYPLTWGNRENFSTTTRSSVTDGLVQGQHGMQGTRGRPASVGLGSQSTGAKYNRFRPSWIADDDLRHTFGSVCARPAPRLRITKRCLATNPGRYDGLLGPRACQNHRAGGEALPGTADPAKFEGLR